MGDKYLRTRSELPPAADSPGRTVGLAGLAGLDGDVGELADGVERLSSEPVLLGGTPVRDAASGSQEGQRVDFLRGGGNGRLMTLGPLGR